jgi:SAM-dependent MidA family methyltransferase
MNPLAKELLEEIHLNGPMTVARFMERALYHPAHGYYSSSPRTGRAGDFLTSPELDPAYGELWARAFEQVWESCGRPEHYEVVEIGPGEAGFARSVLAAARPAFARALTYRLIEPIPTLEQRQRSRLRRWTNTAWSPSLAAAPHAAARCVFANEVLDNLPVHLVERSGGKLFEVWIDASEDRLVTRLDEPSEIEIGRFLDRVGVDVPEGTRFEVGLAAEALARAAGERLSRGAVVFVDYGSSAQELATRPRGSLLCYSSSGVDEDFLDDPGGKDITAHANWTAVGSALESSGCNVRGPATQRAALQALGIGRLAAELKERSRAESATGREVVRALSRRQAVAALVDTGGLGGLGVLVGLAGIPSPPFLRSSP